MKRTDNDILSKLTVTSFNCKNIIANAHAISELFKECDILFVQEHWLFQCMLNKFGDIGENINYAAKGTDFYHPLAPLQLPRGFGGVAILWKKDLEPYLKPLDDGNERIQCVECKADGARNILFISVYLPVRGYSDSIDEFAECIDILQEICLKYQSTHEMVIGGDLNEDLTNICDGERSKRGSRLLQLINDFSLTYSVAGKTYISPSGVECSELDYFLVQATQLKVSEKMVLTGIQTNTSDHHPISIHIDTKLDIKKVNPKNTSTKRTIGRIKWNKVDLDVYQQKIINTLDAGTEGNSPDDICMNLVQALRSAAESSTPKPKVRRSAPKLTVWNAEISLNLKALRSAVNDWAKGGKPVDPDDPLCLNRKSCKQKFRSSVRREHARRRQEDRDKIIHARSRDQRLFYSLIKKQRQTNTRFIEDLNVNGQILSGTDIVHGFKQHFESLAQFSNNDGFNQEYHDQVRTEIHSIRQLVEPIPIASVDVEELHAAIASINKGKSADVYGITIEHVQHAPDCFHAQLLDLINVIFQSGEIPKSLKIGLLTPVFKNKGSSNDVLNYRGITVLPVLEKIIEVILKNRISTRISQNQSVYQRGFTNGVSPLHAALIVEEVTRDTRDKGLTCDLIFLDAKSAFDVVNHEHLLRRLYHLGVADLHWKLIESLHSDSSSIVKWMSDRSEPFAVLQGVKQGGVASTDLYKAYIDPLLHRLEANTSGYSIGNICCNASACADDVTICSYNQEDTQLLINAAEDFAKLERYVLQPKKTEALRFSGKRTRNNVQSEENFQLYNSPVTNVEVATHLGIKRSTSLTQTSNTQIDNNIEKARRTLYSLLATGLHGADGLDPVTSIHLLKTYVLPTLYYGLEIVSINKTQMARLEKFQKKILKQVLSLPQNTSDAAIYMLSGLLPAEAMVHRKVLIFYYSVCLQPDTSVEKRLARRQLAVKALESQSWFMEVKKILWKYSVAEAEELLQQPYSPSKWRRLVNNHINSYWRESILDKAATCKTLKFISHVYWPGCVHPILKIPVKSTRSINRIPVQLKLLTGTYILQSTRAAFNQNDVNPMCVLCNEEAETLEHFVLNCQSLAPVRDTCLPEIACEYNQLTDKDFTRLSVKSKLALLLDPSSIITNLTLAEYPAARILNRLENLEELVDLCRRFTYLIHCSRYRTLATVNSKKCRSKRARAHHKRGTC